ncbi:hypothetical protein [Sorangium sp. So ce1182]|uniref:hypothetical protein n=1 Tax=Sorangium sp. So ce1182 TaxID=3133334 RepID=UPI003F5E0C85
MGMKQKRVIEFVWSSLKQGARVALNLLRIMVPVVVAVKLLDVVGAATYLATIVGPLMGALGLPDSTGLVFVSALLTGVYGGLSAYASMAGDLSLTAAQATVLASLMLIAHGLPVEARVAQQAGVRLWFTVLFRIANSLLFAWMVHMIVDGFDLLQAPAVNAIAGAISEPPAGILEWAYRQALSLAKMTLIILLLVLGLNLIKALRRERLLELVLGPMLRFLGISTQATGITMVGVLLGISYGGSLIASEAHSGSLSRHDVVYSLAFLGLIHSIIEDTALMLLIGADLLVILAGRIVYSLIMTATLVALTRPLAQERFERWFAARRPT